MSFAVFNTNFSSSNLVPVAEEPLWNARQLQGTNIGDLSDVVDQALLVWDASNNEWTWTTDIGGGLEQIGTNLVGTADTTIVNSLADQNVIIGLNSGANPASTGYIGNTTLGNYTLTSPTANYGVAIGYQAGFTGGATGITSLINNSFNSGRVLVGAYAGQYAGSNALDAVAIGYQSGQYTQGDRSIAVGRNAGQYNQGGISIAVGYNAGFTGQSGNSVAIGQAAGQYVQSGNSISIGIAAGQTHQGMNSIAIGSNAGSHFQYTGAIAIGSFAGYGSQQYSAVALGFFAGFTQQASNAIAIGVEAGRTNQGTNSIAIGAYAGRSDLPANVICINATGSELSPNNSGVYIKPMNSAGVNTSNSLPPILYDNETGEVAYNSNTSFDPESGAMLVQNTQVVGSRKYGYSVVDGSPSGFINFGSATLTDLTNFVNQMFNDLVSHGLLGSGDFK